MNRRRIDKTEMAPRLQRGTHAAVASSFASWRKTRQVADYKLGVTDVDVCSLNAFFRTRRTRLKRLRTKFMAFRKSRKEGQS